MVLLLTGALMHLDKVHTFYILWLYGSSVGGGLFTVDNDPFIKALAAFQSAEKKNQVMYLNIIHVLFRARGDTTSLCIIYIEIHGEPKGSVYLPTPRNECSEKSGIALLGDMAKFNYTSQLGKGSGQSAVCRRNPSQKKKKKASEDWEDTLHNCLMLIMLFQFLD